MNRAEMTRRLAVPLLGSFVLLLSLVAGLIYEPDNSHILQGILAGLCALSVVVLNLRVKRHGNRPEPESKIPANAALQKMRIPALVFMTAYVALVIVFVGQFLLPDLPWRVSYALNAALLWLFFCKWNIWALIAIRYGGDSPTTAT